VPPNWSTQLADVGPADRAVLVRSWWTALDEPGRPVSTEVTSGRDGAWQRLRITYLDLTHQPEVGCVVVTSEALGIADPPAPKTWEDGASYQAPTWALQELDEVGTIQRTSGMVTEIFGRSDEVMAHSNVLDVLHPDDHAEAVTMWMELLADPGGTRTIQQRVLRPDGTSLWIESTVMNQMGETGRLLAVSHDISDRRRREADLTHRAHHDELTGLPNRRAVERHLEELVATDAEHTLVLFIDLDGFKEVNDEHGHEAGDRVLAELGERLGSLPEQGAVLAGRWGGDEFVVVSLDPEHVSDHGVLVDRIHHVLSEPVSLRGVRWQPQASVGAAVAHSDEHPGELVRRADAAMYEMKRQRAM
jgi:diguanylate cyclase (GGDEF)-like protein/PAS domain S-box-containing protein